jgi:hypothetical protein
MGFSHPRRVENGNREIISDMAFIQILFLPEPTHSNPVERIGTNLIRIGEG